MQKIEKVGFNSKLKEVISLAHGLSAKNIVYRDFLFIKILSTAFEHDIKFLSY